MSFAALKAGLALLFAFDLQSADREVLLSANGEHFPQDSPSVPIRNTKRHGGPAGLRKATFDRRKAGNHDKVGHGYRDGENRQSRAACHSDGGGQPDGRRRREAAHEVLAHENDASSDKS